MNSASLLQRTELLKKFGFVDKKNRLSEEEKETTIFGDWQKTGFPDPLKSYRLWWEVYDLSVEEPYFWIIDNMREHIPIIEKLEDSFSASENSAFFGVTELRIGGQQDKISQFLATTGKMIKELFQMVRELRIIDERVEYYEEVDREVKIDDISKRKKSADITLKGMFVDLVQGGGKSAASVYGMARELEFVTLPDLFFDAPPFRTVDEMENHVRGLGEDFNENVLRVLGRHLRNYQTWRERTYTEHLSRRRFMISYLKQHFDIIKMYIDWIKPYLRHVEKLTMKGRDGSPEMITAFEGSMLDLEVLARYRTPVGESGANGCLLLTFHYRTRPELKVVQEGYQRGPVHIGRVEINFRLYSWTDEQVEQYKKLKDEETKLWMGQISTSVQQAMESLGTELDRYLAEAASLSKKEEKKEEEEEAKTPIMEKLFGDFYTPKSKKPEVRKPRDIKAEEAKVKAEMAKLVGPTKKTAWNLYKNFKKAHKLIMW